MRNFFYFWLFIFISTPANALYYSASQIGARNYVFPLGIKGDSLTSITIIDTGIDTTHPGFAPGWGQGDFSKKIVGWYDPYNGSPVPNENSHHGTHCAYIAAGNPVYKIDSVGRVWISNAWGSTVAGQYPDFGGFIVDKPGEIMLRFYLRPGTGGYIDTLYLAYSNNREGNWISTLKIRKGFESPIYEGFEHIPGNLKFQDASRGYFVDGWTYVDTLTGITAGSWYTLTYNVMLDKLGLYRIITHRVIPNPPSDRVRFIIDCHWPCSVDTLGTMPDGEKMFTGIAPHSKIVAIKAPAESYWADAFDYVHSNLASLHITNISFSMGSNFYNTAWANTIKHLFDIHGVITIVAAGNDGPGGNNMGYPGLMPEVIAVASSDGADMIASYSSQGGADDPQSSGQMKPDVLAPGGGVLLQGGIWSADYNGDATWNYGNPSSTVNWGYDSLQNDMVPFQGTSMATPTVAGVVNLIIDALGGWNWFNGPGLPKDKALKIKQLLFMTATETNLLRQQNGFNTSYSPTLERGYDPSLSNPELVYYGKDPHEGYGRINVSAAIAICVNDTLPIANFSITDTLWSSRSAFMNGVSDRHTITGNPLSPIDFSIPQKPHCWARKVYLQNGQNYNFYLAVPPDADFDLYLYKDSTSNYGDPLLVARSVNAGFGVEESLLFTALVSGTHYLVVKAVDGKGIFILSDTPIGIIETAGRFTPYAGRLEVYPNPFTIKTTIRFTIHDTGYKIKAESQKLKAENSSISLKIYDATGRLVRQWDYQSALGGIRQSDQITWSGDDDFGHKLPLGVYFVRFETEGFKKVEKAVLLR